MVKIYSKSAALCPDDDTNGQPLRKHLNADALFALMYEEFGKIRDHRTGDIVIPLADALMAGFAMFSLKDPSLLAFDKRRKEEPENLHTVYLIDQIPCDTQMRTILDEVAVNYLRWGFRRIFAQAQRGKVLEKMTCLGGYFLISGDGTEFFSSEKVISPYCLTRTKKNGKIEYYQQVYAAAIVNPGMREVIPLCPEMIVPQDGTDKQDCERNAARRFYEKFRTEHPHLRCIVTEDALSSNAPHIRDLQRLDLRFILGVKPGDHVYLFEQVEKAAQRGETTDFILPDPEDPTILHAFRFLNGVALNKSNQDLLVNFLEYWETDEEGNVKKRFSWVTDLSITKESAFEIMRAGRARWRIENETFNTLKNQGYNLGHNYGLGEKHLSAVFVHLMMLAFLVDQIQPACCKLFQAAEKKCGSKKLLWERLRALFYLCMVGSMEDILRVIALGYKIPCPRPSG